MFGFQDGVVRVARFDGAPIFVGWSTLVLALVLAVFGPFTAHLMDVVTACLYVAIVLLHEIGHAVFVRWRGLTVVALEVHLVHGRCVYEGREITALDHAVIAWGGVVAQLGAAAVAAAILVAVPWVMALPVVGTALLFAVSTNVMVALFNLLPVPGLDGAVAWTLFRELDRRGETLGRIYRNRRR
ncbi:MAG: hypothetical protein H6733_06905 [Alphaproteobacteria bacterium]|nr:hypothetical protein [Alphaproteobacteria bacterium]